MLDRRILDVRLVAMLLIFLVASVALIPAQSPVQAVDNAHALNNVNIEELEEPPVLQRIPPDMERKIWENPSLTFNVTIGFYKSTVDVELAKIWGGINVRLHMGKIDVTPFVTADLLNGTAILALLNNLKVRYIGDATLKVHAAQVTTLISSCDPTWNIWMVKAPDFWGQEPPSSNRGQNIKVAILDTGVNYTVPDLQYRWIDDNNPMDDNGHGTSVASIAISQGVSAYTGVAPRAKYCAIKVLRADGSGEYVWVTNGIQWAIDNGANVINLSLGGSRFDQSLFDKCYTAYRAGIVLVAAVGNDGNDKWLYYPAGNAGVIAVGAVHSNGMIWSGSQKGALLVAPGENVPSLDIKGRVTTASGTSFSAPHVAGAAALVMGRYGRNSDEVRQLFMLGADPKGNPFELEGFGLVDCLDLRDWRALLENSGFEKYATIGWTESHYGLAAGWIVSNRLAPAPPKVGNAFVNTWAMPTTDREEWVWTRQTQIGGRFHFDGRIKNGPCVLKSWVYMYQYYVLDYGEVKIGLDFQHDDGRQRTLTYTYTLNQGGPWNYWWILSRDLKSDFQNQFGIPLNSGWRIISVWLELRLHWASPATDWVEVFFDEILIGFHN